MGLGLGIVVMRIQSRVVTQAHQLWRHLASGGDGLQNSRRNEPPSATPGVRTPPISMYFARHGDFVLQINVYQKKVSK